ncbi:MAG: cob(I)yrinic acid a,c-diamide adenosyltransferase [Planctomycetota bacterium]|nr:MAG: cob(I)yrinic acid a,c-diamide adenosyltransferase [Planctomycetota bacterium]
MKIYTRTGDEGETGLFGGDRVRKDALRICAYGEVDELNAALGWCAAAAPAGLGEPLRREMARLFVVGAHLAVAPKAARKALAQIPVWDDTAVGQLEAEIDGLELDLAPLHNFILPGGNELSSRLHLARTICRRAERSLVALAGEEKVDARFGAYLNRLSDWLFVLARAANHAGGVDDVPWVPVKPSNASAKAVSAPAAAPAARARRRRERRSSGASK